MPFSSVGGDRHPRYIIMSALSLNIIHINYLLISVDYPFSGGKLKSICDKIRLPDDCTLGYIISKYFLIIFILASVVYVLIRNAQIVIKGKI